MPRYRLVKIPESLLALIVIAVLFLAIGGPALNSGFVLNDDHEIISIASQDRVHPQVPVDSWQGRIFTEEPERGRFRPLYYTSRFVLASFLGADPLAWHVVFILLGILTIYLLYSASRVIGIGFALSLLFAGLVLLTRGAPVVWIRLGANETFGTLFTAVGLLAMAQASNRRHRTYWDVLLAASALLAGLCKESFVLILPAIAAARLVFWQERWQQSYVSALRVLWPILSFLTLSFIGLMSAVILVARSAGQGSEGDSAVGTDMGNFVKDVLTTAPEALVAGTLLVPLVFCIVVILRRVGTDKGDQVQLLKIILLCLLFVSPQILLYHSRGGLLDRFVLPSAVPLAALNVAVIIWLQRQGRRWLWRTGVGWLAGWALLILIYTLSTASHQRAEGLALNRMVNYVAMSVPQGKSLVIVADPAKHYEESIALLYLFGNSRRSDMPVYLLPVPPEFAYDQEQKRLADTLVKSSFFSVHDVKLLDPKEIGAVVYLDPKERIPEPEGAKLRMVEWERIEFSEPWFQLGVRVRRLFYQTNVAFLTDIPNHAQ